MMSILRGLCVLFLVIQSVPADAADDFDPEKVSQQVKIFDTMVKYPAPSWMDERLLKASEYYRDSKPNTFIFEQIPKGEKFDSWTKLYAVTGTKAPQLDFKKFVWASLDVFAQACGKDNLKIQTVAAKEKQVMVVVFCEDSPNGPTQFGYGPGKGEITVMLFARPFDTHIKIYQHWRGESFDATDKASWPVSEDEVRMMISRFSGILAKRVK
jgi:hypothetical protein